LVLTGKTLGTSEIQVRLGKFVRSLVYGADEYVPIARNCPVSCKLPTAIVLGTMASESRGSGAGVLVITTVAVPETTLPSGFANFAIMVVDPAATPSASPDALTVAMVGMLELHVIWDELVTSVSRPVLPRVASAMNCPV
jgi:hypothetical protein